MAGRKVACFISLPNSLTYQFEIRPNDPGNVCLDKVSVFLLHNSANEPMYLFVRVSLQICGALAIVEKDYFGLLYKQKGFRYWLNLRNDIDRQVKSSPPYRFELRVKYFIGPEHIQQEATRFGIRNTLTIYLYVLLELSSMSTYETPLQTESFIFQQTSNLTLGH